VEPRNNEIKNLVADGASRLLARAEDSRSLKAASLSPRIAAAVEKYLLRDEPETAAHEINQFIDGMQADDLCLTIACEQNDEGAWSELVERFTPAVRSAARSASSNEDAAEDLVQSIWAELYGLRIGKDGKPSSKLAYYSGRGSLAGWLRAVASQLAVDVYRKQSRLVQTEEDADLDRLVRDQRGSEGQAALSSNLQNPEKIVADKFAESDVQSALGAAVKELAPEDRLLVKLYYFDDMRLREAGVVLGVHEATASRRLTRIHNDLRKRITQILVDDKGWTKAEAERSFAELAQNLNTDLEALVTREGVS
jgi:RNA polymerase sigma-70 factor (ECF subfamily)